MALMIYLLTCCPSPSHSPFPSSLSSGTDVYCSEFTADENQVNQQLFEDQQQMLEGEVERLSGLVQTCSESLTNTQEERVKVVGIL